MPFKDANVDVSHKLYLPCIITKINGDVSAFSLQ